MRMTDVFRLEKTAIMQESFAGVLNEHCDLLEDAVEAILDMKLGLAIAEGDGGEYVSEDVVMERTSA